MEQTVYNGTVHQHMEGTGFQSHFVPAEKPYAVYGFTLWEKYRAAQHIGTIIIAKRDDKGMRYDNKPVWRIPEKDRRWSFDAYVDDGHIESDVNFVAMQGSSVGYDCLLEQLEEARCFDEDLDPNAIVASLREAGVGIDVSEEIKERNFRDMEWRIDYAPLRWDGNRQKEGRYYLCVNGNAVMWVRIDDDPCDVLARMSGTLRNWRKLGMGEFSIKMDACDEGYQTMIDELMCVADMYGALIDKEENLRRFSLRMVVKVCRKLGVRKCMQDDILTAMCSVDEDYSAEDAEQMTAHLVELGVAERRGNVVEFSEDFYRIISWKFVKMADSNK